MDQGRSSLGDFSQRRLGNLEVLRFLAATLVVFFHIQEKFALELGLLPEINSTLGILGAAGVDVFFVISGFVIALNISNTRVNAHKFLGARIARIVPTYWLLTLCAGALIFLVPAQFDSTISIEQIFTSLFFVNTFFGIELPVISMGWTLNLEIGFYILVTASLFVSAKFRFLTKYIVVASLLIAVIFFGADSLLLEFLLGFIAYWVWIRVSKSTALGLATLLAGVLGFMFWLSGYATGLYRWQYFGIPAFLLVLSAVLLPQTTNQIVTKLGFASYSIYLTQWFTIPACIYLSTFIGLGGTLSVPGFVITLILALVVGVLYSEVVDRRLYQSARKFLHI